MGVSALFLIAIIAVRNHSQQQSNAGDFKTVFCMFDSPSISNITNLSCIEEMSFATCLLHQEHHHLPEDTTVNGNSVPELIS